MCVRPAVHDLVIRRALVPGWPNPVDISIDDQRIVGMGPQSDSARATIDAARQLVLPALVESRTHWDTALTVGRGLWNQSGTLAEALQLVEELVANLRTDEAERRMHEVVRWYVAHGAVFSRAHVNVSDPQLKGLRAALAVKKAVTPMHQVQVAAFPQKGLVSYPDGLALLQEAIAMGVDVIGAVPHLEGSVHRGRESIRRCLELAQRYPVDVDVTCDETDDPTSQYVLTVAQEVADRGMGGRVTVSHVNAMALYNEETLSHVEKLLAQTEINVVVSPTVSSLLQGRGGRHPLLRGLAPIRRLMEAGVNVSLSHDDVMSPFYPLGTGNMLHTANMAVHVAHMAESQDFSDVLQMITTRGAKTLGLQGYGLAVGNLANLVMLPVDSPLKAIQWMPKPRLVISAGKIVAQTELATTHFADWGH